MLKRAAHALPRRSCRTLDEPKRKGPSTCGRRSLQAPSCLRESSEHQQSGAALAEGSGDAKGRPEALPVSKAGDITRSASNGQAILAFGQSSTSGSHHAAVAPTRERARAVAGIVTSYRGHVCGLQGPGAIAHTRKNEFMPPPKLFGSSKNCACCSPSAVI